MHKNNSLPLCWEVNFISVQTLPKTLVCVVIQHDCFVMRLKTKNPEALTAVFYLCEISL